MSTHSEAPKPAAPAVPFSYAQAARGVSKPVSTQASNPSSGAITPAREQNNIAALKSELNGARWSDSVDEEVSSTSAAAESSTSSQRTPVSNNQSNGTVTPATTDHVNSSTTTLVRSQEKADASMAESKAQSAQAGKAENSRNRNYTERASSRGRRKGGRKGDKKETNDNEGPNAKTWIKEKAPEEKLVDAPLPTVNPWLRPKVPPVPKPAPVPVQASATPSEQKAIASESQKPVTAVPAASIDAQKSSTKQESGVDNDERRSATEEKVPIDSKPEQSSKPPQPVEAAPSTAVDTVAWPKPETAQDQEQKKKLQEKSEADAPVAHEPKVKPAWNKLDFTPTVVFSTALPGSGRRGGEGGKRGGRGGKAEGASSRGGSGSSERRSEGAHDSSGREGGRRERSDATSSSRAKRGSSDDSAPRRTSRQESLARDSASKVLEEPRRKSIEDVVDAPSKQTGNSKSTSKAQDAVLTNGTTQSQTEETSKQPPSHTSDKPPYPEKPSADVPNHDTEAQKTEVSSVHTERKANTTSDFSSRHHERKNSGSYSSTFSGRGGRGRGGRGEGRGSRNNGHTFHANAAAFNGHVPYAQSFGNPKSPTGFGQEPYMGQTAQGSQRYYGRGQFQMRATSIPGDGGQFARMPNGYASQPLQVNTGVQGNGTYPPEYYPATAVPYQSNPVADTLNQVAQQLEYYFSIDNLIKDTFMRKHMDSQGFVPLTLIADFKKLKSMTQDLEIIRYVCQQSPNIEHKLGPDGVDRLRPARHWAQWVFAKEERDPSAQNDGPESLHQPPPARPNLGDQPHLLRHSPLPIPQSAGPVLGGQGFQSLNGFAPPYNYASPPQFEREAAIRSGSGSTRVLSSPQSMSQAPSGSFGGPVAHVQFFGAKVEETEADSMTDAQIENLRVVVRDVAADAGREHRASSSSTLPNGAPQGPNGINVAPQSPPLGETGATMDGEKPMSPTATNGLERFLSNSSRVTSPKSTSQDENSAASGLQGSFYIKDKDGPSHTGPPDTQTELYLDLRARALEARTYQPCPYHMEVLYNFWEHFLVRNYNSRLYMEFRTFAMEDASTRSEFKGLNSLLKYYGKAIAYQQQPIRRTVAQDYVSLVRAEPRDSDRPAFKQLRAAWRDGALNMKNRKRVKDFLDEGLEKELDR